MHTLFTNISVVTMDEKHTILENAYVGITDEKITYLSQTPPEETATCTVDGRGKVLMPSLYNTHTHLPMSIFRGFADEHNLQDWLENYIWPAENKLTSAMVETATQLSLAESIAGGSLGFTDMYFFEPRIAQMALDAGVMANLCNAIMCFGEHYDPTTDRANKEMLELIAEYHGKGGGRIKADCGIHGEYTSNPEVWAYAAEVAKKHDIQMHLHLSETQLEHENCIRKYGKTPARLFYDAGVFDVRTTAAHCVWVSEEDMALLAEKNVTAVHDPGSNLKLASGVQPYTKLRQHGVRVSLATDSACAINTNDLFFEMKLASLIHKGLLRDPYAVPATETLRMATVAGAYAQGREKESGTIALGYDADLIVLDFDKPHLTPCYNLSSNIVYAAKSSDVWLSMCKGKILYKNGEWKTLDIEKIKFEMKEASKLFQGAPQTR